MLQEQLEQKQLRVARLEQAQVGDDVDDARSTAFALESAQERLRNLFTLANQRLALLGSQADAPESGPSVSPRMVAGRARGGRAPARCRRRGGGRLDRCPGGDALRARRGWMRSTRRSPRRARSSRGTTSRSASSPARRRRPRSVSRPSAARSCVSRTPCDAATERRETARAEFAAREAEAATADAGEGDLDEAYELAQADVFEAEGEIERLREELHTLERERDALAARTGALSLALDQKDGSAALVAARLEGVRGLVAEHIRVHPGYEAAIAAALGTLADAVLAEDRAQRVRRGRPRHRGAISAGSR